MKKYKAICFFVIAVLVLSVASGVLFQSGYFDKFDKSDEIRTEMKVSWAKTYNTIKELTESSDLIAVVEITEVSNVETDKTNDEATLYYTTYSANVTKGIKGENSPIEIIMTGKKDESGTMEISDDPLMSSGDKYLIFARLNDSGIYTILSGPNGRFTYDSDSNTISSLNDSAPIQIKNKDFEKIEKQLKDYMSSEF